MIPAATDIEDMGTEYHSLFFYLSDDEIQTVLDEWTDWLETNVVERYSVRPGSISYSTNRRQIVWHFESKDDAALFRVRFGGWKNLTDAIAYSS